mmetsp:Transcript_12088/g.29504  ORF Transcript_12088/g.29504 Transcript_12088/m.29504 type:complete len:258 (-) Transcript_12088:140-913(-)
MCSCNCACSVKNAGVVGTHLAIGLGLAEGRDLVGKSPREKLFPRRAERVVERREREEVVHDKTVAPFVHVIVRAAEVQRSKLLPKARLGMCPRRRDWLELEVLVNHESSWAHGPHTRELAQVKGLGRGDRLRLAKGIDAHGLEHEDRQVIHPVQLDKEGPNVCVIPEDLIPPAVQECDIMDKRRATHLAQRRDDRILRERGGHVPLRATYSRRAVGHGHECGVGSGPANSREHLPLPLASAPSKLCAVHEGLDPDHG